MTMHHRGTQIARLNKILLTGIMGGSAFGAVAADTAATAPAVTAQPTVASESENKDDLIRVVASKIKKEA